MRDVGYRTQDEVDRWKAKDPIPRYRTYLTERKLATAAELDAIDAEVQAMVAEAEEFARNSPWPDGATATDHVYYTPALAAVAR
jgi:TPP-dependent pyruvate/acetoin dehydrogenase alpha subunit